MFVLARKPGVLRRQRTVLGNQLLDPVSTSHITSMTERARRVVDGRALRARYLLNSYVLSGRRAPLSGQVRQPTRRGQVTAVACPTTNQGKLPRRHTESAADDRDAGNEPAVTNERGVKVRLGSVPFEQGSAQIGSRGHCRSSVPKTAVHDADRKRHPS